MIAWYGMNCVLSKFIVEALISNVAASGERAFKGKSGHKGKALIP